MKPALLLFLAAMFVSCLTVSSGSAGLDFLVPGISLRSVTFEEGTRVSYFVISESYGVADTSVVELGVLEAGSGIVLLEVTTCPYPQSPEETVWVRLRLEERVREIGSPDEFMSFVQEVLVREGAAGAFEQPDEGEVEELELERMFLPSRADAERVPRGSEEIETPAGGFLCDVYELKSEQRMDVKLGGVDAERYESEETLIWISPDVPFWGLVRSRIERESSTILPGDRRYQPRAKRTVTESILVSFARAADR